MKPWPDNLKTNWLKESIVRREQIKGWLKRNAPVEFGFIEYLETHSQANLMEIERNPCK